MTYFKSRYISRTFHQRIINFLNALDHYLSIRCSLLHALLFRSRTTADLLTRIVLICLSVLVGVIHGYMLHHLFIGRLEGFTNSELDRIVRLGIVWTIAIGYAQSTRVRAIVCLILPTMLAKGGRAVLFWLFFAKILDLVVGPLVANIGRLFLSLFCFFGFRVHERYIRFELTYLEPLKTIATKAFTDQSHLKALKDMIHVQNEIQDKQMNATFNEMHRIHSSLQQDSLVTYMFVPTCQIYLGYFLIYQYFRLVLRRKFHKYVCQKMLDYIVVPLLNTHSPMKMHENFTKLNSMINKLMVNQSELFNITNINASLEAQREAARQSRLAARYNDLAAFQQNLLLRQQEFDLGFPLVNLLVQVMILYLLVSAVLGAITYQRDYLTALEFDNLFVNRYFHRIDERRRKANKPTRILPLHGPDKDDLTYLYSPGFSTYEQNQLYLSRKTIVILCCLSLLPVYFNIFLVQYMTILDRRLVGVFHETIVHRFNPQINASDLLAPVKLLVSWMQFNLTRDFEFDLRRCSYSPTQLSGDDWIKLALYFVFTLLLTFISTYVARIRSILCDYFFPRQGKHRALNVYNNRLVRRKNFLAQKQETIKFLMESNRIYPNGDFDEQLRVRRRKYPASLPWMVRFFMGMSNAFKSKHCFVCADTIKVPYISCDTITCQLLYCEQCWLDMSSKCLNCGLTMAGQLVLR